MAPLTPGTWLERLAGKLDQRWYKRMGPCDAYFEGDQMLAYATGAWREAFGSLFRRAPTDNWMPLVVESKVERMEVQGFRFGKQQSADEAAWELWQANGLDAESDMAHTEAVKLGEAYWLVEPPAAGSSDPPRITLEVPHEFIVAYEPGNRRRRSAALKKWVDDDGYVYATLYLPNFIYKYRSQNPAQGGRKIEWQDRPGDRGGTNPLGIVPAVPLRNAPTPLGGGTSDLKVAMPIQDVINKLLIDMLLTSEYLAFPQRVLLGIEVPKDPVTGQPIRAAQLEAQRSRLWAFEAGQNGNPSVAEFSAADLKNYVEARQHLIHGLSAKTRTPPHYILGEMVNVSGDALTAAEAGLTSKTRRANKSIGEGHEETIRLAFLAMGDKQKAAMTSMETIWRDPERLSVAQLADAAVKKKDAGVPWAQIMEDLQYSQVQIARMQAMKAVDDIFGPLGQPAPTNVRVAETTTGGGLTQTPPSPAGGAQ
jgi:hypothetical protein